MELQRLLLECSPALEDALVECLLENDPPLPGFTVQHGDGHGSDFEHASLRERVRGRIARSVLSMVLPAERVAEVLAQLRARLAGADVRWITQPVHDHGTLT
ncbi:MAG: DUF3240 family protein [Candidatus Levyibacteriota bacterium]